MTSRLARLLDQVGGGAQKRRDTTVNYMTSRPLVLTVAALALLGAPALLSPSAAQASQSQAAIPPAYMQMLNAMASAQSDKLVSDSTSNGGIVIHIEFVSARYNNVTKKYITSDTKIGTRHTIGQLVFTGTHLCMRQSSAGAWNCRAPAATVAAYAAGYAAMVDPRAMEALGVRMSIQMSPAGRKVVQQQMCTGYGITSTTTSSYTITGHGTYWLNAATGRPVEMDTVAPTHSPHSVGRTHSHSSLSGAAGTTPA